MKVLMIFLGGGLGAAARYGLAAAVTRMTERTRLESFPAGIFVCNTLGCLLIGVAFGLWEQRQESHWMPFLTTGFLGGFTTFSTFGRDTHALLSSGLSWLALANVVASVLIGVIAVFAGMKLVGG